MKYDFLILGATGMQGRIISRDLHEKGYKLLLSDKSEDCKKEIAAQCKDLPFIPLDLENKPKILEVIKEAQAEIVINCAEDDFIPNVLRACIAAEVHHLDLGSYMPSIIDIYEMDQPLKEKGLLGLTGCGSTPGIGNVMLKHAAKKFDTIETIEAGFAWDSNIKEFVVPFSMEAIFYEFVYPAYIVEDGKMVKKEPMKNQETRTFRGIGEQTIMPINHSEPYTFYHNYKHKGVKKVRFNGGFPKHSFDKIKTMIELGLHGIELGAKEEYKQILINGKKTYMSDIITAMLKEAKRPEGYKEVETLWVTVEGKKDGKEKTIQMECIVPTLPGWEDAGCNIDTGLPSSIMAQMVKEGVIQEKGLHSPETIIPEEKFFAELYKRKMLVYEDGKIINEIKDEEAQHPNQDTSSLKHQTKI